MKKTLISLALVVVLMLSLCVFAQAAPKTGNQYYIPQVDSAPNIDGKGNDSAWKNAFIIEVNPGSLIKNGGWAEKPKANSAKGTLKVVWSEKGSKGAGLYFMWDIKDSTQSFAYPYGDANINAMDCVQVLIDPMYQRRGKLTGDTCQVYTFAPYTSRAGNGFAIYPEDSKKGSTWYEHFSWVGMNNSIGVKAMTVLDAKKDTVHTENNRNYLVSGYHIEAYIPFSAMSVKNGSPKGEVGTKLGIGFLFVDYDWDYDRCDWIQSHFHNYQKLLNISADFTNGGRTNKGNIAAFPLNWNTLYLADKDGKLPDGTGDDTTTEAEVDASQKVSELVASFEALKAEDYTEDSYNALKAAYDALKGFKDDDTSEKAVAAKEAFVKAFEALVEVTPEEPSEATEPTAETEKPSEDDTKTDAPAEKDEGGLSTGAIVGIVIGAIALIAIIVVVVVVLKKKKSTDTDNKAE